VFAERKSSVRGFVPSEKTNTKMASKHPEDKHVTDHGETTDDDFDPKGIQKNIQSQQLVHTRNDTSIQILFMLKFPTQPDPMITTQPSSGTVATDCEHAVH
jgi:hypothetical protein